MGKRAHTPSPPGTRRRHRKDEHEDSDSRAPPTAMPTVLEATGCCTRDMDTDRPGLRDDRDTSAGAHGGSTEPTSPDTDTGGAGQTATRGPLRIPHTLLRQLIANPRSWWTGTVLEYALQIICDGDRDLRLLPAAQWNGDKLDLSWDTVGRLVSRRTTEGLPPILLWPINITNTHWTLLILDPRTHCLRYYDPLWHFPFNLLRELQEVSKHRTP